MCVYLHGRALVWCPCTYVYQHTHQPTYIHSYHLRDTAMEVFLRRGRSRTLFVDFGRDAPRDKRRRDHFVWRMAQFLPSVCFDCMYT
jgi:hypothetical protein